MKTILLVATTVICLLLGVFVHLQLDLLRDAQAEIGRTLAAFDAAKRRADEADQRLATAEKSRMQAEEELKAHRENPAPTTQPPAPEEGEGENDGAGLAMLNTPGMQKMLATMTRGGLDQRYGPLFRKLKLSPADLAKFKDQLVEQQMSGLDVIQAASSKGGKVATDEKAFAEVMGSVQGELEANIRTLLGDAGYKHYEDFNQKADTYGLLDQVERRLGYTNSPLQAAQSEALMTVLAETAESGAWAGTSGKGGTGSFMQSMAGANPMLAAMLEPRISEATITAAEKVLTPSQVEVLREIQAEQAERVNAFEATRDPETSPEANKHSAN